MTRHNIRLGDIANVRSGYMFKSSDWMAAGVPVVKIGNVKSGYVELDGCSYVSEYVADQARDYELGPSDIVIAMTGYVGEIAKVGHIGRALLNQRVGRFTVKATEVLHPDFLFYYLRQEKTKAALVGMAHGSAQPNLSSSAIHDLRLEIPSLREQQAIADVLSALDDKIAVNTRLAATSNEIAGLTYDQSVIDLPTQAMSEALEPVLGGTPTRAISKFWGGTTLWASAKDITGAPFAVVTNTDEKITRQAVETTKAKPLPAGSVILTARGTVGAVARLGEPSAFNQSCYGFVPGLVPPGLLYFSILRASQQAKAIAHGSVFDTITKRTFDHIHMPVFGDKSSELEARVAALLTETSSRVQENTVLAATRDALLPQLMSGKLGVKHAEEIVMAAI